MQAVLLAQKTKTGCDKPKALRIVSLPGIVFDLKKVGHNHSMCHGQRARATILAQACHHHIMDSRGQLLIRPVVHNLC
jgi:hypothetical protein